MCISSDETNEYHDVSIDVVHNELLEKYGPDSKCLLHDVRWFIIATDGNYTYPRYYGAGCYYVSISHRRSCGVDGVLNIVFTLT